MARSLRIAVLALGLLLVSPATALAQIVDNPPPANELEYDGSWTPVMPKALVPVGALIVVGLIVGYVVKAREFKANARRGGSK